MKKIIKVIIFFLLVLTSIIVIPATFTLAEERILIEEYLKKATVLRIVDGDTVIVSLEDNQSWSVRLIGFDAPEDTTTVDPFGPEATAYLRSFLPIGQEIYLTREGNNFSHNRLRRHIWLDYPSYDEDIMRINSVAARMILAGYGEVIPNLTPNFRDMFLAFEEEARNYHRGMWGVLNEQPEQPQPPLEPEIPEDMEQPEQSQPPLEPETVSPKIAGNQEISTSPRLPVTGQRSISFILIGFSLISLSLYIKCKIFSTSL